MDDTDKERLFQIISQLAMTFGRSRVERDAPPELLVCYWNALKDLPIQAVARAAMAATMTHDRMPVPATLRRLAGSRGIEVQAETAWLTVIDAIRTHGYRRSVIFEDAATGDTLRRLGGWERMCNAESEELHKWLKKEFIRAYALFEYVDDAHGPQLLPGRERDDVARIAAPYLTDTVKIEAAQ